MTTNKYKKIINKRSWEQLAAIEILKTIEHNPRITPLEISKILNVSSQHVRNILTVLMELKLVETPARGVYIITELGRNVLKEIQNQIQ